MPELTPNDCVKAEPRQAVQETCPLMSKYELTREISNIREMLFISSEQDQKSVLRIIQSTGRAMEKLDKLENLIYTHEFGPTNVPSYLQQDPRPMVNESNDTVTIQAQLNTITVKDFRELMKKDPEYRHAFHDNIAMAFKDNVSWYRKKIKRKTQNLSRQDIHAIANGAAKYFLDIFLETGPAFKKKQEGK